MFLAKVVGVTIDNQYMDDRGKFNLNASGLMPIPTENILNWVRSLEVSDILYANLPKRRKNVSSRHCS